jgi:NADH:ubiquinone oxidoreductase subunit E
VPQDALGRILPLVEKGFGSTLQLITLTALYSIYDQNQLNLIEARNVVSFDVMYFPHLENYNNF